MHILILAGGAGTRLWPVSRKNKPKQISDIFYTETMIERTWRRLCKQYRAKNIFISTDSRSAEFIEKKLKHLPKDNLIIEPIQKGTAAAIAYGASYIYVRRGNGSLLVLSSDAHIGNEKEYLNTLRKMESSLHTNKSNTLLVGAKPKYAETGYGYIKAKKQTSKSKIKEEFFKVEKFIEKPQIELARKFASSPDYFWNPAIFGWHIEYLAEIYKKYLPRTYEAMARIFKNSKKENNFAVNGATLKKEFSRLKDISIDYGILEKEKRALMIAADFGWSDIGHWRTLHEILRGSPEDNVVRGKHVHIDSSGNLIYSTSGRLIATAGLKDMIIIETDDALLICPRDRSQDVKQLTKLLSKAGLSKYL